MTSTPTPHSPHDTGSDPLTPGPATAADVTIQRMYYTLCQVCRQPFNDWSDSLAEARRKRTAHLAWHKRSADEATATAAAREE
jgi:hypothetical protein